MNTTRDYVLESQLRTEILQLRLWAAQSVAGGWSTHQVEPMRKRADELETLLMRRETIEL